MWWPIIGSIAGAAIEDQGQSEVDAQARARLDRQREELERTKAERVLRRNNYRRALSACLEGRGYTVR